MMMLALDSYLPEHELDVETEVKCPTQKWNRSKKTMQRQKSNIIWVVSVYTFWAGANNFNWPSQFNMKLTSAYSNRNHTTVETLPGIPSIETKKHDIWNLKDWQSECQRA